MKQKAASMGSVYKNYGDEISPPPLASSGHPWDTRNANDPDASLVQGNKNLKLEKIMHE